MTLNDFKESCEDGGFIDYDGFGFGANATHCDPNIVIQPSDVLDSPESIHSDITHIIWFNK